MKCATWFGAASASRSSTIVPSSSRAPPACSAARPAGSVEVKNVSRGGAGRCGRASADRPGAAAAATAASPELSAIFDVQIERDRLHSRHARRPCTKSFTASSSRPSRSRPTRAFSTSASRTTRRIQLLLQAIRPQGRLHRPDRRHRHRQDDGLPRAARAAGHDVRSRR